MDSAEINNKLSGTDTVTRGEAVQGMPGYKEENGTILMMLPFLLAISAFVLGVFFYVITMQKTNQFGIMKAIGASNRFLSKAIVSQVFILSLTSIVVGILLTYATAAIRPKGMPFKLETSLVVTYSIILLVIAMLSSMVSVRKITFDPLKALGRVE
ncbi:ABC transporter permease [Paenibacillus sp. TC-CSREp1]|uniref:ABC transporter permease n=1 Tax=Paenibacillus sp. TC-CSREp1 TaxID=3410089 RepID=UPI003CFBF4A8